MGLGGLSVPITAILFNRGRGDIYHHSFHKAKEVDPQSTLGGGGGGVRTYDAR